MRDGRIEAFRTEILGSDRIREMHVAGGALFAATAGGGLLRIDGEKVTRFTMRHGLPTDRIWALEDDGRAGADERHALLSFTRKEGMSADSIRARCRWC
jgi:hypothetical protein